jgi:hemolysin III
MIHPPLTDAAPRKPRLRGVLHEFGFYVAVGLGIPLVLTAEPGRARFCAVVYVFGLAACFGISAVYHRPTWSPLARRRLARLDHAGIYLLIAATYTPFGLLVLSRDWAIPVLSIVWAGAAIAILLKVCLPSLPKKVSAGIGLALGWVAIASISELLKLPPLGYVLVLLGGCAYTLGAVVYARRRPDPIPHVFGYHELFHALTLVAAGCQFAAIAFYVLPRG